MGKPDLGQVFTWGSGEGFHLAGNVLGLELKKQQKTAGQPQGVMGSQPVSPTPYSPLRGREDAGDDPREKRLTEPRPRQLRRPLRARAVTQQSPGRASSGAG